MKIFSQKSFKSLIATAAATLVIAAPARADCNDTCNVAGETARSAAVIAVMAGAAAACNSVAGPAAALACIYGVKDAAEKAGVAARKFAYDSCMRGCRWYTGASIEARRDFDFA